MTTPTYIVRSTPLGATVSMTAGTGRSVHPVAPYRLASKADAKKHIAFRCDEPYLIIWPQGGGFRISCSDHGCLGGKPTEDDAIDLAHLHVEDEHP